MLFFNKTTLLSKLQGQPRSDLRTSPSGLCFSLIRVQICLKKLTLSETTLTLFPVKSCLQVVQGFSVLSYFI